MLNRVILIGRLTKDPSLTYTPNGVPVCSFTLAVGRAFKNQNGERETDFINVVAWRSQGENAANYLKKGSMAGVDGRIQTRNYEGQDGRKVYVTEVLAESVQFLDSKGSNSQSNTNTSGSQQNAGRGNQRAGEDPFSGGTNVSSDDLPF